MYKFIFAYFHQKPKSTKIIRQPVTRSTNQINLEQNYTKNKNNLQLYEVSEKTALFIKLKKYY